VNNRLGIGTTGPTGKLEIKGGDNSVARVLLGFNNTSTVTWGMSYGTEAISNLYVGDWNLPTTSYFWRANYSTANVAVNTFSSANTANNALTVVEIVRRNTGDTGDYLHITSNGGTSGNLLTVDKSGNVGIGTTGPTGKLHINLGVGSATNSVKIDNTSATGYSSITLRDDRLSDSYGGQFGLYGTTTPGNASNVFFYNYAGGGLDFYAGNGVTPANDLRMRITSAGQVNVVSTLTVGSVAVPTISSTHTLTNKAITPRILSAASYTTDTGTSLNCDNLDSFIIT